MTVKEIIRKLWQFDASARIKIIVGILGSSLKNHIIDSKVKETALNCYAEDMYIGLLMQESEKTLDEFCEVWGFNELVQYLRDREDRYRDN